MIIVSIQLRNDMRRLIRSWDINTRDDPDASEALAALKSLIVNWRRLDQLALGEVDPQDLRAFSAEEEA